MQIHELPAGSPASGVQFAGDTGTQTQKIDYDALADAILNKLTTKTFNIKSKSQTIIAALNALGDASKQDVANDLVTTAAGLVLDARQGKALKDLHDTNANAIASLNSRTYSTSGLTYAGCSNIRGGYCVQGNLVIVNISLNTTSVRATVSGFPSPQFTIGFCGYDGSNEKPIFAYMNTSGTLVFPSAITQLGSFNISLTYVKA